MTKFELPEKPKKTNTSEDFNNLRKAVDELDEFDYTWKTYANKADRRINAANKHIEELERENQRLVAENLAVKTLVDNAKPQQSLPVVPECVGIAIESLPDDYSAFEAISLINAKIHALPEENKDWLPVYNWLREDVKNQDIFALAFITGKYEVEKPQLFYLKNKLTGDCLAICLARASSGLYVEVTEKWLTRKEQTSYKLYFTQQEIDSMHAESYEQIEVTE